MKVDEMLVVFGELRVANYSQLQPTLLVECHIDLI
jgi:hypothetical protein